MILLDDFQELQRKIEKLQREADKASGAVEILKQRLKDEFGCLTLKEAKNLLEQMKQEEILKAKQITAAMKAFQKEHADLLSTV